MRSRTQIGVPLAPDRPKAFRVATRAGTMAEFVDTFWRFTDEKSIFLPVAEPLPLGRRQLFRVTLADGTPVMTGEGEVVESVADRLGAFGRNGMRVRFVRVSEDTQKVHRNLLLRRYRTPQVPPLPGMTPVLGEGSGAALAPDGAAAVAAILELEPSAGRARPPSSPGGSGSTRPTSAPGIPSVATSDGTLPANPLAAVSAEALEHFVDCVIYEDALPPPDEPSWAPIVPTPAPPVLPPTAVKPLLSHSLTPLPAAIPMPIASAKASDATPMALDTPFATGSAKVITPPPLAAAPSVGVRADARAAGSAVIGEPPAASLLRTFVLICVAAVAWLGVGVLVGWLMWGRYLPGTRSEASPLAGLAAVEAPAPHQPAAPAPDGRATVAPTALPPPAHPEPVEVPPASAGCRVTIITDPPGAKVTLGTLSLGATPVRDAEVACRDTLVLEHPRYERVEKLLELEPGAPETVSETLARPVALLTIQSAPPGALVRINGRPSGRAPVTVRVAAFEQARVSVLMADYKPWSEKVYVRGKQATVQATLEASRGKPKPKQR